MGNASGAAPEVDVAGKKVLLFRRPRGVIGVIMPWNWPYTMPAELIAPALACGNTVVWTPASTTAIAGSRSPSASSKPICRRASSTSSPGRARASATRSRATGHARRRLHRLDRAGRKVAEAAAGKAAVLELGGNGPSSSWTMPISTLPPRRPSPPASSARAELHRRRAAARAPRCPRGVRREACTARHRAHRPRRSVRRRTTMGPLNNAGVAAKMDEHVADALERGASSSAAASAQAGIRRSSTGSRRCSTTSPTPRSSPRRRRSAPSHRSSRSTRSSRRSS